MLHEVILAVNDPSVAQSLLANLQGIIELILGIGGAVGYYIKRRSDAKRERERTATAAATAAQEAKEQLEQRLQDQYEQQLQDKDERIDNLEVRVNQLTDLLFQQRQRPQHD